MRTNNILKSFRQNTIILIDAANLFYCQKTLNIKIDYKKLFCFLKQYKRIVDIRIYISCNKQSKKEKQFIVDLKSIGYKVIQKELKIITTKNKTLIKKGNLDIELALDAYELQNQYRTIVLFSGDSDFETLLKRLRRNAKRCIVVSTYGHAATELYKIAHKFIDLKKFKGIIKKSR